MLITGVGNKQAGGISEQLVSVCMGCIHVYSMHTCCQQGQGATAAEPDQKLV